MGNIALKLQSLKMSKNNIPVVVVLGCTGTGKSKLAIELAKKFNGEIISADSMQVYKGLDIVTNKVTPEEQKEVSHHCIDFLDPLCRYTVVDFRNHCLPIIDKLFQEKKIPIIVGGTNYYIESLLWKVLIKPEETQGKLLYKSDKEYFDANTSYLNHNNRNDILKYKITQDSLDHISSQDIHKCLQEIDPDMSNALHPEDRRKTIRSLQVFQQTGFRHSELLEAQRSQKGGSSLGGPLRFQNTIMFWLQCEKEVLAQRLDDRVDEMVSRGLINELNQFHKFYNENRKNDSKRKYSEGIFQSIGFKEFHDYLILSPEEKDSEKGKKILNEAIDNMKLATRQYARKQTKWITNRFLKKPDRQLPPVYGFQATNLNEWLENVLEPAINITNSVILGMKPTIQPLPVEEGIKDMLETHYCDICERIFVGRRIWEIHLQSRRHSRRKENLKKRKTVMNEEKKTAINEA